MNGKEIIRDAVKTIQSGDCSLFNSELIEKCNLWIDNLCATKGKAWTLRIPADHNRDPDLLFKELIKRLIESQHTIAKLVGELGDEGKKL